MSADLHIHVMTDDMTEEDLRCTNKSTLGSKWGPNSDNGYDPQYVCYEEEQHKRAMDTMHYRFHKRFPNGFGKNPEKQDENAVAFWEALWKQHYRKHSGRCSHDERVSNTPNIWIGAVSWLKAALFEDSDTFIPQTVNRVCELIGEDLPVIDDALIEQIVLAFSIPNNTVKENGVWDGNGYELADVNEVKAFLETYKGKRCFTISW